MQLLILRSDKPPHFKGDIVEIRATGAPFSGAREMEAYVVVEVPDVPMTDYEQYSRKWELTVGYEIVNQNQGQDAFRLRMFATDVNGSLGALTRENVETFINEWRGSVHSVAPNEVIFNITIYDALTSQAFWWIDADFDVSALQFAEIVYDQGTGIHRIAADYSAIGNNPTFVERYVNRLGLTIISHSNKVLTYDADRSVVRRLFEEQLADKVKRQVARRRYHVTAAVVDAIVSQGGTVTTDEPTMLGYIRDKATD